MAYGTVTAGRHSDSAPGVFRSLVNALTTASTASTYKQITLDRVYSDFAFQVVTGTTKVDKFILEGSLDGANFTTLGSSWVGGTQISGQTIWITSKPCLYVRAKWTTKATTSAINAYIGPAV